MPILARGGTHKTGKLLCEITGIIIADDLSDLLNLKIGVTEQSGCLVDPFPIDKIDEGDPHMLMKLSR